MFLFFFYFHNSLRKEKIILGTRPCKITMINIHHTAGNEFLRDYLIKKGLRYKLSALNPNNHKMFWLFIDDEKLNNCLIEWKKTKP